ncbi:MAG TPA: VOC family protein, partial [Candidatus Saccharimonadales bacterium]|nr:VOC family protein [Candidatus Saccharimonadales bacterium]
MLSECDMSPVLAVKDLQKGKEFYSQTLGLEVEKEDDDIILFSSGDTMLQVYQSQYAGTNQATAATWEVEDLEDIVSELKDKGITFEQYDLPGASR